VTKKTRNKSPDMSIQNLAQEGNLPGLKALLLSNPGLLNQQDGVSTMRVAQNIFVIAQCNINREIGGGNKGPNKKCEINYFCKKGKVRKGFTRTFKVVRKKIHRINRRRERSGDAWHGMAMSCRGGAIVA
jgi:hypothetical protein